VETNTIITVGGFKATIDYVTGQVVCDLSTTVGKKTVISAQAVAVKESNASALSQAATEPAEVKVVYEPPHYANLITRRG
jgi:fructose-specific component phosphotransferase system IIB-like protein